METGIIKRWNEEQNWGIIFCTGLRKFFLHRKFITQGTPALFARVTFDVGQPRHDAELPHAINVVVL